MNNFFKKSIILIKYIFRWVLIAVPVSFVIGSMVALFLWMLNLAIHLRFAHPWLLYLLPLAGITIHFAYKLYGKSSEKGNNLIIDEIYRPGAGVPKRMGPLILVTTVITHLFGGSAGREGTAVQIGGSIGAMFGSWFKLNDKNTQTLLTTSIAAGFGAVFGTPVTGAVFAIEVLTIGRINYNALWPCLIAGLAGDLTVSVWKIKHTAYHISYSAPLGHYPAVILLILKVIIASVVFGLVSLAFARLTHGIKSFFTQWFQRTWMIPVAGGFIVIALTWLVGKPDYLSLGVEAEYPGAVTIVTAFSHGGAHILSWFWKLIFTAVTLGTGFKGGEVTPLFYIGATLGNTLANLMGAPESLFAALGFIAVFAGATKTPVACTIMGVELFGIHHAGFFLVACFIAYFFSGHAGIYSSQIREKDIRIINNQRYYISKKLSKYTFIKIKGRKPFK